MWKRAGSRYAHSSASRSSGRCTKTRLLNFRSGLARLHGCLAQHRAASRRRRTSGRIFPKGLRPMHRGEHSEHIGQETSTIEQSWSRVGLFGPAQDEVDQRLLLLNAVDAPGRRILLEGVVAGRDLPSPLRLGRAEPLGRPSMARWSGWRRARPPKWPARRDRRGRDWPPRLPERCWPRRQTGWCAVSTWPGPAAPAPWAAYSSPGVRSRPIRPRR